MLAESFLKRRYEAGLQEGREEGREEGMQQGIMQERKRSNANLRALAEKYGIPESELPFRGRRRLDAAGGGVQQGYDARRDGGRHGCR